MCSGSVGPSSPLFSPPLAATSVPHRRDYYATIKFRLRVLKVESESVENTTIYQLERREDGGYC